MHRFSTRLAMLAAGALCAAALPCAAAGSVDVSFIAPETFTDAGRTALDRERTTRTLGDQLRQLARALPDGQTLQVDVLDVDLAGRVEPHGIDDLRILRGGADWPRLKLRYALRADGRTLQAGEETIADLNYAGMPSLASSSRDLPYEERLLTRWFRQHFVPAPAGAANTNANTRGQTQ